MKLVGYHIVIAFGAVLAVCAALWEYSAEAGGVVGLPCDDAALTARLAGGGLVTFNCGGTKTIVVFSVKTVTQTTTIDGGGVITLSAEFTRLFSVTSGVTLTLRNIILADAISFGSDGGAISSAGTLVVENSTIRNSLTDSAHSGGAIYSTGRVVINNSRLFSNT